MDNPFTKIIEQAGNSPYQVLEEKLRGIVSNTTFYNLIDERGIPAKTQWETVVKVAEALGYRIELVKDDSNI